MAVSVASSDNPLLVALKKNIKRVLNMKLWAYVVSLIVISASVIHASTTKKDAAESDATSDQGIYTFTVNRIDGIPIPLSQFKGKVVLIINVASKCGFTSQYKDLEALYQKYKGNNFVIIGVPANNFGNQEPGSNQSIQAFCSLNYGVSFPMTQKISVNGNDIHPLFRYLTTESPNRRLHGAIKWNFTKFLINQEGQVVSRYGPFTNPMGDSIKNDIDRLLEK